MPNNKKLEEIFTDQLLNEKERLLKGLKEITPRILSQIDKDASEIRIDYEHIIGTCVKFNQCAGETFENNYRAVLSNKGGIGGGASYKPGNIRFNMSELIESIATGGLTLASVNFNPLIAVSTGIVLWFLAAKTVKIEITEVEATVYWTLWINKDNNKEIKTEGLIEFVNNERSKYSLRKISEDELEDSLNRLIRIGCIVHKDNFYQIREDFHTF